MNTYLVLKWLHIVSSVLMVGTGLGSAFYMFFTNRSGSVPAQAQDRRGHAAVHGGRDTALAGEVDRQLGDLEVELGPAQLSGRDWGGSREKRRGETGDRAADRQPLDETAPRDRPDM